MKGSGGKAWLSVRQDSPPGDSPAITSGYLCVVPESVSSKSANGEHGYSFHLPTDCPCIARCAHSPPSFRSR